MNIADLRQEYMRSGLSETQADPDPIPSSSAGSTMRCALSCRSPTR